MITEAKKKALVKIAAVVAKNTGKAEDYRRKMCIIANDILKEKDISYIPVECWKSIWHVLRDYVLDPEKVRDEILEIVDDLARHIKVVSWTCVRGL